MTDGDSAAIARIEGKIDVLVIQIAGERERGTDHEVRIRGLEKWRYALPTSIVLALASVGAQILAPGSALRYWPEDPP
jgi:hypothetical protein